MEVSLGYKQNTEQELPGDEAGGGWVELLPGIPTVRGWGYAPKTPSNRGQAGLGSLWLWSGWDNKRMSGQRLRSHLLTDSFE